MPNRAADLCFSLLSTWLGLYELHHLDLTQSRALIMLILLKPAKFETYV